MLRSRAEYYRSKANVCQRNAHDARDPEEEKRYRAEAAHWMGLAVFFEQRS